MSSYIHSYIHSYTTDYNTYANILTTNTSISHNMEDNIEQRLNKVYESDIIKNILAVLSKLVLNRGEKFIVTISYKHDISVTIARTKPIAVAYIRVYVRVDEKVIIDKGYDTLGDFLIPGNTYTEDLEKLIRRTDIIEITNVEQYRDIKQLVVSLCKKQIKLEKALIDEVYMKRIESLNATFCCTARCVGDDDYERTERMEANYVAYDKWILTQEKSDKERWVVIQNGEVFGIGDSRENAYQEARKDIKYMPGEDALVTTF